MAGDSCVRILSSASEGSRGQAAPAQLRLARRRGSEGWRQAGLAERPQPDRGGVAGTGAGAARARRRRGGLDAADIFIAGSGARRAARARHLQIDLNIFINVRRDLSLISRREGGGGGEGGDEWPES